MSHVVTLWEMMDLPQYLEKLISRWLTINLKNLKTSFHENVEIFQKTNFIKLGKFPKSIVSRNLSEYGAYNK